MSRSIFLFQHDFHRLRLPRAAQVERATQGLRSAHELLAQRGLPVRLGEARVDALAGAGLGLPTLLCGTSTEDVAVASVEMLGAVGHLALVGSRAPNVHGLLPEPGLVAAERAAWDAGRPRRVALHAEQTAAYARELARHRERLAEHDRAVADAKAEWERRRSLRLGKRAAQGLARLVALAGSGLALIALSVWIYGAWDLRAYYDKVFHTWMVLLIIKLLATLVPVVVIGAPLVFGIVLVVAGLGAGWRVPKETFEPPPSPPEPDPPRPFSEAPALGESVYASPAHTEHAFFHVVRDALEATLREPGTARDPG
jgi:hypothetical protein